MNFLKLQSLTLNDSFISRGVVSKIIIWLNVESLTDAVPTTITIWCGSKSYIIQFVRVKILRGLKLNHCIGIYNKLNFKILFVYQLWLDFPTWNSYTLHPLTNFQKLTHQITTKHMRCKRIKLSFKVKDCNLRKFIIKVQLSIYLWQYWSYNFGIHMGYLTCHTYLHIGDWTFVHCRELSASRSVRFGRRKMYKYWNKLSWVNLKV